MLTNTQYKAPSVINESGDYSDCYQSVYDVLSVVLATDEHRNLGQFSFKLLFCKKIKNSKGRRTLATIKLLGDKEKLLSDTDVLIVIDFFFWTENPEKQEALLFHELCHLLVDEEGDIKTVGHDVEEFYSVIKRYGDWNRDVKPLVDYAQQTELDLGVAAEIGV